MGNRVLARHSKTPSSRIFTFRGHADDFHFSTTIARTIAYKLSMMTSCPWAFFLIWVRLQVLLIEGAIVSDCIHHQSLGCLRVEKS
jgi:hypothetical protein